MHAGGPSSPAAVGCKLSSIISMQNTSHSLTYSSDVSHRSPTPMSRGDVERISRDCSPVNVGFDFRVNVEQIS